MRFRDLLPGNVKKQVGYIAAASWDSAEHGIRFTIRFEPSGRSLNGVCKAGADATSGAYIAESDLRSKLPKILNLPIYEHPATGDPNQMSAEDFKNMKIQFSLSNLSLSYHSDQKVIDTNTFLSRILR